MSAEILAYISVGLIVVGWLVMVLFDTANKVKNKLKTKSKEEVQE
ncbi:MAG: hypothetical protein ACTSP7_10210 [Candidatus Heimdallarchaeota archaeon]